MKWRVVLSIAQKDIVDAVKNMYVLFTLILPVGLSLLLGLLFPSQTEVTHLNVIVFDPEGSQLVAGLREMQIEGVEIVSAASADILPAEVQEKGIGGFVVPTGFDTAVAAGQHPELIVYLNNKHKASDLAIFQEILQGQIWAMAGDPPVQVSYSQVGVSSADNSPLKTDNIQQYMLGIFLVIGITMAGVFVVPTLMVEEKEKHTLDALLVSPASPSEVVAGKALVGLFYCMVEAAILILLNSGWVGNLLFTIVAVVLGSLFSIGLGLFLGSLFRTTHQVNTWAGMVQLLLMLPGWLGIMALPGGLTTFMKLVPTYYMSATINMAMTGKATLASVGGYLGILAGCTAAIFVLVVWALKRDRERV